jgi:hypothetical protein
MRAVACLSFAIPISVPIRVGPLLLGDGDRVKRLTQERDARVIGRRVEEPHAESLALV